MKRKIYLLMALTALSITGCGGGTSKAMDLAAGKTTVEDGLTPSSVPETTTNSDSSSVLPNLPVAEDENDVLSLDNCIYKTDLYDHGNVLTHQTEKPTTDEDGNLHCHGFRLMRRAKSEMPESAVVGAEYDMSIYGTYKAPENGSSEENQTAQTPEGFLSQVENAITNRSTTILGAPSETPTEAYRSSITGSTITESVNRSTNAVAETTAPDLTNQAAPSVN